MKLHLHTDRVRLYHGDAAHIDAVLAPESVDAIVTDPPAGIGFMGKSWDGDKGGRDAWIAWLAGILRSAMALLKPGGHALVWALPRTSHWTATALEDAGFEIRDVVVHLFGCLSDDTEILVEGEWRQYQTLAPGQRALCYNPGRDAFAWEEIQHVHVYPHADTAVRVRSDRTDQIVTRGHRCLVERDGGYVFESADSLEREARVPVLEDLRGLLAALPLSHEGAGDAPSSVPRMPRCLAVEVQNGSTDEAGRYVPAVRDRVLDARQGAGAREVLLDQVLRRGEVSRPRDAQTAAEDWGARPCRMDGGKPAQLHHEDERATQSGVEGRRDVQAEQGQLYRSEVRALPGDLRGDVEGRRLRDGASARGGDDDRPLPDASGVGSSRGPQHAEQLAVEPAAVRDEPGPQAVRGTRFTVADLATVEPVYYEGVVWCVQVPSGAFVARRNGKVFVTGNTGFPKSLDVAKAIDATMLAGGSRTEDMRRLAQGDGYEPSGRGRVNYDHGAGSAMNGATTTGGVTPEGASAIGLGTALKPAAEHWILCRRPLAGTVAETFLAHGTGALRIDDCRIAGAPRDPGFVNPAGHGEGWGMERAGLVGREPPVGRWPANVVLNEEAAAVLDEQSGERKSGPTPTGMRDGSQGITYGAAVGPKSLTPREASTGGASRFFYVAKPARSEKDAGLDHLPIRTGGEATDRKDGTAALNSPRSGAGRTGGARNHHPTVKSIELMRYLCRLVTPKGGTVLDLFAGSGTTGVAAMHEGLRFVGVEQDAAFADVAAGRLAHVECVAPPTRIADDKAAPASAPAQTSLFASTSTEAP